MIKSKLKKLYAPFDNIEIIEVNGISLRYLKCKDVLERLNDVFESVNWNFKIKDCYKFESNFVVLVKLRIEDIIREAFGSSDKSLELAVEDGLKKAASLLGIGLVLYDNTKTPQDTFDLGGLDEDS